LLITIDRQSETENTDWAYKAHPDWFSVETIRHENYYDVAPGQLESTFREIAFFEIYSSHHLMLDFVRSNFRTLRYKMYEEGVATRLTESESTPEMTGEVLYAVRPNVMLQRTRHLVQIPKEDILAILERNSESYRLSTIDGNNNVLFLMPGVVPNGSPRKDLHDSYVRIFEFLKNKGYEVFVARHPRVPDFPEGNRFGPAYVIEDSIPVIDLYIYRNRSNIAMIIGQYSTLLCDSQYLYGIPALQLTGKMDNDLQNRMKIMQDSIVPSVHDFIKDLPHLLH
jgi:hypothetical protein